MSLEALFPTITSSLPVMGGTWSPADDFEVLGLALEGADLTEAVQRLEDFTLFASTDAAFAGFA